MKLTRDEIILLVALVLALMAGAIVKEYRIAHPVLLPEKLSHPGKK
jgi:hypothetical protein